MSLDTSDLIPALRDHLVEWLPSQGWFGALRGELTDTTVVRTEALRRE